MSSNYNQRLFSGGFRKWLHEARFAWINNICTENNIKTNSVLELGCFDGRAINYLPKRPENYYGFDANWENGLDQAKELFASFANYHFVEASHPSQLVTNGIRFDLAISLETIEHIPPEHVDEYLLRISKVLDGMFLVTVPNEKGLLFLVKYLVKKFILGGAEKYTASELLNATLGRMGNVRRNQHKGFDWEELSRSLSTYFDIVSVEGVQFPSLPLSVNAQIGFVLRSKA